MVFVIFKANKTEEAASLFIQHFINHIVVQDTLIPPFLQLSAQSQSILNW